MISFGDRIRELRILAGLSQEALAKQLGVSSKTIQRYERGSIPEINILSLLVAWFGVSADYLLGLKSYEDQLKERAKIIAEDNQHNSLYKTFFRCLNFYKIDEDTVYYWIELQDELGYLSGHTAWAGWADRKMGIEIRKLRPIRPNGVIENCKKLSTRILVINSKSDAEAFLHFGGNAIVNADICDRYLPEFIEDYIVKSDDHITTNISTHIVDRGAFCY